MLLFSGTTRGQKIMCTIPTLGLLYLDTIIKIISYYRLNDFKIRPKE